MRSAGFPQIILASCFSFLACEPAPHEEVSVAMFRGTADHVGVYEAEGVRELGGVLWSFPTEGPVRSSPAVTGDRVYVGSADGRLYCLDRFTGIQHWSIDVGSGVSSSPAVAQGRVFFGSRDGVFHAVDTRSGELVWRFETGEILPWEWGLEGWDIYTSSPVVVGDLVVFGSGDGAVYALTTITGEEVWRFQTGGRVRATPAVADGVVFFGSTDGSVYALDLEEGQEKWRRETEGAGMVSAEVGVDRKSLIASPAVASGLVFVGSRDGYMYALDQETGEVRWRVSHDGSWAMSSPAVSDGTLYAGTSDGRFLHAVDIGTGEEIWRSLGLGYTWSSPAVAGEMVYIGDGGGWLRAVDRTTGLERWSFPAGDGVYSSPVVHEGTIFFGTEDGSVIALRGGGGFPRKAVFWDEAFTDYSFFRDHIDVRVFFKQAGYEVLDTGGLVAFLESRLEDGAPSVVVFAMDHLPTEVSPEAADTVLFRRYLGAGGKAVWPGLPPMFLARDSTGQALALDRSRAAPLLGVDHSDVNFDFYASMPTDEGRGWGLDRGWVSSYSVSLSDSLTPLALDETGRAGAWVKAFGGPPGTGYVGMGFDQVTRQDLELILIVAEYGLSDPQR